MDFVSYNILQPSYGYFTQVVSLANQGTLKLLLPFSTRSITLL